MQQSTATEEKTTKTVSESVGFARLSLAEKVIRSFAATGYLALRYVTVVDVDGLIILRGRVATYYLKQICQSATVSVPGVDEVQNEVEVA